MHPIEALSFRLVHIGPTAHYPLYHTTTSSFLISLKALQFIHLCIANVMGEECIQTLMQPILLRTSPSPPLHHGKLHTQLAATIHSPPTALSLLKYYSRAGLMCEARSVFDAIPDKTPVAWTVLMSGYALHGPFLEVLSLLRGLLDFGLRPDPFIISVALKACASFGCLERGREVHCAAVKLGYVEDLFVANALVTMYSGCGSVGCSETVFKRIRQPDLVSWTAILSGLLKNGYEEEALRLFVAMARTGIRFDTYVLSIGLNTCVSNHNIGLGSTIHSHMIKMDFCSCLFLMNSLLEFYGRIGELGSMRKVFSRMLDKNLVSLNTIISCHARSNSNEHALTFFHRLTNGGSPYCDEFTLGSVLQAVTGLGALKHGKEIHGYAVRTSFGSNTYVTSALLNMYINCKESDAVPITLFIHFHSSGGRIDEFIVASIVKWCASVNDLETGKTVHSCATKLGLNSDNFVASALIDMYAKCGTLSSSCRVFAGIKSPGTVAWSSIIAAHCCNGEYRGALELFREMQWVQVRANEFTYTSAIAACIALGDYKCGAEIHCSIIRTGYSSNGSVINSLINLYSQRGDLRNAFKLTALLPEDQIIWGSLVQAFGRVKNHERVLEFFEKIQRTRGQLDHQSVSYVIDSCDRLRSGMQAHAYFTKRGLLSDPNTNNSLIDMYSKCREFGLAVDAFDRMAERNAGSWTAVIAAYVYMDRPSEALSRFVVMVRKGKRPDAETFLYVITACGKMGLIEEAFRLFTSMVEVYRLEPSREIYMVMVEALGSAGMLEEAAHFIGSVVPKCYGGDDTSRFVPSSSLLCGTRRGHD